jgi:hypothetical protein
MISRVLHKCAFEALTGFPDSPELNPRFVHFAPLREYVRRPKSATEFQPFAWKRHDGRQEPPLFGSMWDRESNEPVADVCQLSFPGVQYVVAYPPWPVTTNVWQVVLENGFQIVDVPGITNLAPEEIRIQLLQMRDPDTPPPAPDHVSPLAL